MSYKKHDIRHYFVLDRAGIMVGMKTEYTRLRALRNACIEAARLLREHGYDDIHAMLAAVALADIMSATEDNMRQFNPKLSLCLDRMTVAAERGNRFARLAKRLIEWFLEACHETRGRASY